MAVGYFFHIFHIWEEFCDHVEKSIIILSVHGENSSQFTKMATWKPNQREKMVSLRWRNKTKRRKRKKKNKQNKCKNKSNNDKLKSKQRTQNQRTRKKSLPQNLKQLRKNMKLKKKLIIIEGRNIVLLLFVSELKNLFSSIEPIWRVSQCMNVWHSTCTRRQFPGIVMKLEFMEITASIVTNW